MAAFDPFSAFSGFFGKLTPNTTAGPDVVCAAIHRADTPQERREHLEKGLREADKDRLDRRVLIGLGVIAVVSYVYIKLRAG